MSADTRTLNRPDTDDPLIHHLFGELDGLYYRIAKLETELEATRFELRDRTREL